MYKEEENNEEREEENNGEREEANINTEYQNFIPLCIIIIPSIFR